MPENNQPNPFTSEPAYSSEIDYEQSNVASAGSILGLGLLIAIASIFGYMDNKPYSAWTARVSLNTAIFILTTACTRR
ncbi:hypothetical protein BDV10DRAFT_186080 [Aspergillus recurvatus]